MNIEELTPSQKEDYEERAAIREYDGNQPREVAEREALKEVMEKTNERI